MFVEHAETIIIDNWHGVRSRVQVCGSRRTGEPEFEQIRYELELIDQFVFVRGRLGDVYVQSGGSTLNGCIIEQESFIEHVHGM